MTPWTTACQASLSITNSQSLLKLISIELVMPSNHLILCCPLLLPPSLFSSIRVFSDESGLCIRWQKYWSFSFSIIPSNEPSGLTSLRSPDLGSPSYLTQRETKVRGGGGAHPRSYRWSRAEPGWGLGSLSPRGWLYIGAQSFLQLQTTNDEPHLFGEEEVIYYSLMELVG